MLAVHAAGAQRPDTSQPPAGDPLPGTGIIRGRIVAAAGGTPVRRAEVRAASSNGNSRLVASDADGRYEIRDLTPGSWTVSVSKAGFVTQRFGQRRPFDTVKPIALTAGQQVTADVSLTRAGAISGYLSDEYGDPVAGARVQVRRSSMSQGTRRLIPTGVLDTTDDTGAFRLYGLAPAEYYVAATLRATSVELPSDLIAGVPVYFPGTGSVGDAQRLVVGPGEEISGINFSLTPLRAVRLSGMVVDSTGLPAEDAAITLFASDSSRVGLVLGNFGRTDETGTFTAVNVPPGSHTIEALLRRGTSEPEQGFLPITVGADDLSGITIATSKGTTINGRIVVESGSPLPQSILVTARSTRGTETQRSADSRGGGTFSFPGLFGAVTFGIEIPGQQDRWMVPAIELDGVDVTDQPLEFAPPSRTATARIVITDRLTELTGTVTSGGGPAAYVSVIVFPDDASRWGYASRRVRMAQTDEGGGFTIRGLPPDSRYLAAGVDSAAEGEWENPEFLQQLRLRSTGFSLEEGGKKNLNLALTDR